MLTFLLATTICLTEPRSKVSLRINPSNTSTRRDVFQSWLTTATAVATTTPLTITSMPVAALARNLPQDTGADRSATGTLSTLIPVVKIQKTLSHVNNILLLPPKLGDGDDSVLSSTLLQLQEIKTTIANIPTMELKFKRIFDEYSDPVSYKQKYLDQNAFLVYYTKGFDGPNRPSIEADVSDLKQTLQYGARNEAWVAWEGFVAELQFAQQQQYPVSSTRDDDDGSNSSLHELLTALQATQVAVDSYLSLAPPADLVKAEQQIK